MPSSPWPLWEAKGPVPCEEVNPRSTCTEVWTRSSASSPYDSYVGGEEIPSLVSLPPASCRSLPTRRSLRQPVPSIATQEPEASAPSFASSVLEKIYVSLPLYGPSTASTASPRTVQREETSTAQAKAQTAHKRTNRSTDPRQIAADDFGDSLSRSKSKSRQGSFLLPSTLVMSQYSDKLGTSWRESSPEKTIRPLSPWRQQKHSRSTDATDDAHNEDVTQELSSLALLGISLCSALGGASATEPTSLETAGDALGSDGKARPSMTYP